MNNNEELRINRVFYKKGDRHKYHIVNVLKKENSPQVVYKFFGLHKKRWFYEIESVYTFNYSIDIGYYQYDKREYSI